MVPVNDTEGVNPLWPSDAIWEHRSRSTLVQVMALVPDSTKPLPEPMLTCHQHSLGQMVPVNDTKGINPCLAEFLWENIKVCLCLQSFYNTDMLHVVEILPHGRQRLIYYTYSISWLFMIWRCKEPGHQQSWWLVSIGSGDGLAPAYSDPISRDEVM